MPHHTTTANDIVASDTFADLHRRRLDLWRQTSERHIRDAEDAGGEIARLGLVTLYPVSPEIPNLFSALLGDPEAKTDPNWDSPSGEVYTWRWVLGRREVGMYAVLVRGRPTWIAWELLPAALRLWSDARTPDELADAGLISADAYRVARALDDAGGALPTGELRAAAGFPTGKEQRAAFLKAVAELDDRLLLAKTFAADSDEMTHALISARYPTYVAASERLAREAALDAWLLSYLPLAVYTLPAPLARHTKLPEPKLRAGLERLVAAGVARQASFDGQKGACYVWESGGVTAEQ
jgi:hypothetical protein